MSEAVLLDTSFFIRLLKSNDKLNKNAVDYFKYFLEKNIILKISTITIAEYCAGGEIDELPLRNLQIVPFNVNHAIKAGYFAKALFANKEQIDSGIPRLLIPNDAKLFAQAEVDETITHYITSDTNSLKLINTINNYYKQEVNFKFVDIKTPYHEVFGELPFN